MPRTQRSRPTAADKAAVWQAYRERRPTRVPLRWNTNVRIVLLDPALNPEGYTFAEYLRDPQVLMTVQARHQEYVATTLSATCDAAPDLPAEWSFRVDQHNTYDGAYFGAPITCLPGQCPSNEACMGLDDVDAFLARDWSRPLDNPWIRSRLAFHAELERAAADFRHLGRKGKVAPFRLGFDGPVTCGAALLGADMFTLLALDPDKARRFLETITTACFRRNVALINRDSLWEKSRASGLADDSVQLISTEMFESLVLPLHGWWYDQTSSTTPATGNRSMHLCGDATRHFPLLHERLGVDAFDTGYPVDHGALRRALGPDVEISGGPEVALLRNGTPDACAARARAILQSGVMTGGRFILQEGNNLPPCCPLENLNAVYETCLEFGAYPTVHR